MNYAARLNRIENAVADCGFDAIPPITLNMTPKEAASIYQREIRVATPHTNPTGDFDPIVAADMYREFCG